MEGMTKVSCIIPAYNEGPRIEAVISAVYKHPLMSEIIVVDDGSRDETMRVIKAFTELHLISNEINRGKSYAVMCGLEESKEDLILLLDSDLRGLTPQNISDLIEPVVSGRADISISLRRNSGWFYRMIGLDYVSGERVFPKKLIEDHMENIKKLPCYGLESYLNRLIVNKKCRIKVVPWDNVCVEIKARKIGFLSAVRKEIIMIIHILRTVSLFEIPWQIIKMHSLLVKR
jgi:glycosyltransferase involved in cell wall biosynthesis